MNLVQNAVLMTFCAVASGLFALSPGSAATDALSDVAPPPLRTERAPPPRDGYVWGAGHWELSRNNYVWVSGTWIPERRGAHWIADHWDQTGAQWRYVPGHWER
jgi:hypothetical protein